MENAAEEKYILRGGDIVLPDQVIKADLVLRGGMIEGILRGGVPCSGYQIVDVTGMTLLPGVIDPHVHMWEPSPQNYREDWYCGSQCAASGGITTIIDMPLSVPPVVDRPGFEIKLETASKASCVDFAFWGGLTPGCIGNMRELHQLGCVAYKGFMSFANPDYPQITDGYLIEGMKTAAAFDGLIGLHAENAEAADFGAKAMAESGETDYARYDEARPWWVELEAIQRAVLFGKMTGARLYICHMTAARGAEFLKKAKCEGARVSVETCPHYLLFDHNIMREKGAYAKCNPPIRSRENVEQLWNYVFDGTIDTIGSDHGPYQDQEKVKEGNFFRELCGFGGYDAMLAGMLTEGVCKRGLSLPRLAELMSGNTAKIMGLFPRKGSLLPGADADIAVVDMERDWVFDGLKSFSKTKSIHNIYHGYPMKGKVMQTWVRGKMVYDDESIIAPAGYGIYIPAVNRTKDRKEDESGI